MSIATDPRRADLLDADESFFAALLQGDRERLEEILGPDFVIVDVAEGGVADLDAFLAAVGSGVVTFVAIDRFPDEAVVRGYGDVGVVVGRTRMTFSLPDGSIFTGDSRYTHVFAGTPGGWRLVSAQGTAIGQGPGAGS